LGLRLSNNNINNNNFNRNSNVGGNRPSNSQFAAAATGATLAGKREEDASWKHNPQHRGGAPYRDRATADRLSACYF